MKKISNENLVTVSIIMGYLVSLVCVINYSAQKDLFGIFMGFNLCMATMLLGLSRLKIFYMEKVYGIDS